MHRPSLSQGVLAMSDWHGSAGELDAPVILVGRGGSGTRMLSFLAGQLGVFLGNELNVSLDSVEWIETLYDLAIEATLSDILPGSPRDLYWRARLRDRAAGVLASRIHPRTALWGWKLPETILALGPVLRAFPRAQVVHLVRHPVTSCLRRTHMTSRMDNRIGNAVLPAAYRSCGLDPGAIQQDEPYIHNAVTWSFQVGGAIDNLRTMKPATLVLRYEDVCASPVQAQSRLAQFLGIDAPPQALPLEPDKSRMNQSVEPDARAQRIWLICREPAQALGYEESLSGAMQEWSSA